MNPIKQTRSTNWLLAIGLSAGGSCFSGDVARGETRLSGAGATFPAPFYKKIVYVYEQQHPDVKIHYGPIGSGGGIRAITDKTVPFGATDAPMTKKELEAAGGADSLIEFPSCAGGVVPVYNLKGVAQP